MKQVGVARISSAMTFARLAEIREKYRIPDVIDLLILEAHDRTYCPRPGCVVVSEYLMKVGMRLPLYPFFRMVLRSFLLAST